MPACTTLGDRSSWCLLAAQRPPVPCRRARYELVVAKSSGRLGLNTMRQRRTAYELSSSQVSTPSNVVALFWQLAKQRRSVFDKVLDMGAGDCRFALGAPAQRYIGVEIDKRRIANAKIPVNGQLSHGCVFRHSAGEYDACIGNPPYVRHHDIEGDWKQGTVARLAEDLGFALNKHSNLYLYFLCLGLIKTHDKGLVALVIPYEWVSRPSAQGIRHYIEENGWDVDIYRFNHPIFKGVLTTASISIIDKQSQQGRWRYYNINDEFDVVPRHGVTESAKGILSYERRGAMWALRGLSPGSQKVFTLTDGERIHNGLRKRDVVPCVTTLRHVPRGLKVLSQAAFRTHFIEAGQKCWLIRSYAKRRSDTLSAYLRSVPLSARDSFTCKNQTPWFNFLPHPVPRLLVASAFTSFGPKTIVNAVGARAVGTVFGIHAKTGIPVRRLQRHLAKLDFEEQVVPHAKTLKKIEVKQLNAVLNAFNSRRRRDV
jgi:hypothetical protein